MTVILDEPQARKQRHLPERPRSKGEAYRGCSGAGAVRVRDPQNR